LGGRNHGLEGIPLLGGGPRPSAIHKEGVLHHGEPVLVRVGPALPDLGLDGGGPILFAGAIAGVDGAAITATHGSHLCSGNNCRLLEPRTRTPGPITQRHAGVGAS